MEFSHNALQPVAVDVLDGDLPGDRTLLLGGNDGYVRKFDEDAYNDDGTQIEAYFIAGPLVVGDGNTPLILSEIQGVLDENSADIKYEVLVGDTPDEAIATATPEFTGDETLSAGLGTTHNPRKGGRYIYLKIGTTSATGQWALERVRARLVSRTSHRGRRRET
jgi:hypothetical protein